MRLDLHLLRKRAVHREGHHEIARPDGRDAVTDGFHDAGELAARRKRQRRLELVFVLDDEDVGKVEARRLHGDHDVAGARRRRGHLLNLQPIRRPELGTQQRFHEQTIPAIPLRPSGHFTARA
jgi:hypothetical protein